jgi:hypothetical protein
MVEGGSSAMIESASCGRWSLFVYCIDYSNGYAIGTLSWTIQYVIMFRAIFYQFEPQENFLILTIFISSSDMS